MWSRRAFGSSLRALACGSPVIPSAAAAASSDFLATPLAMHEQAMRLAIVAALPVVEQVFRPIRKIHEAMAAQCRNQQISSHRRRSVRKS
jgi:hypothetical protein